jgi:outer membrane protein OmpA-like peptidoglycan-associated protein
LLAAGAVWALCLTPAVLRAQSAAPSAQEIIDRLAPAAAPASEAIDPGGVAGARPGGARTRNLRIAPRRIDMQIPFEFDSAALKPESEVPLQQLSLAMQSDRLRDMRFLIEGHTDAKGSATYNERLSGLRARSVSDYLVKQGVDPQRLQSVGKGFRELLPDQPPLAAAHRRVRIVALD